MITYGKNWFAAERRMTEIWTEEQAREAHRTRQPYAILLDFDDIPACAVEVLDDCINVDFLDHLGREVLTYQFQELEPGRLFLSMAVERTFKYRSDQVARGALYLFWKNGKIVIEDHDFSTMTKTRSEGMKDVSGNWEPYPAFGEYDSITSRERGLITP
jgi:hypothetical protein